MISLHQELVFQHHVADSMLLTTYSSELHAQSSAVKLEVQFKSHNQVF